MINEYDTGDIMQVRTVVGGVYKLNGEFKKIRQWKKESKKMPRALL